VKTILVALTGIALGTSGLLGQEPGERARVFQFFGASAGSRALDEGFNNRVVRGKPFSATEERRSLQVLQNGTRIENNQTNRLFRDSEGRTRVEEMNGMATIFDPATNRRVELNPTARTARSVNNYQLTLQRVAGGLAAPNPAATNQGVTSETTENLGAQVVNGVPAQGVRTTMTIPKGQIGNDREIKVVTERWVSNDLQMTIKSSNSDPRFGDTSYQLTGILEREPDASLFQIPAGYTEVGPGVPAGLGVTPGGRTGGPAGGRGPGVPGGRGGRGGTPNTPEPGK
jgi:hypothetical protein